MTHHIEENNIIKLDRFIESEILMERDLNFRLNSRQIHGFHEDSTWWGLPLISEYYLVHFNSTTLDALGLQRPPPWAMKESDWTWNKFVEYAIHITKRSTLVRVSDLTGSLS